MRAAVLEAAGQPLVVADDVEIEAPGPGFVKVKVSHCGICHSDLAMKKNHWEMTAYPFVPGHEVSGVIAAKGEHVTELELGQKVGLGWFSGSCMHCDQCMGGDHNLCASNEGVIVGRHGGFASRVRCGAEWAVPIPDAVDPALAGPLFCGGITVFNPMLQYGPSPSASSASAVSGTWRCGSPERGGVT